MTSAERWPRWTALGVLFTVNFFSLLLEIVWFRRLMAVFGSTALTASTLFSIFLAGLALGGAVGGRRVLQAADPARWAGGVLVVLTGLTWVSLPVLDGVQALYQTLVGPTAPSLVRHGTAFLLSALVLLGPTTCIGILLPTVHRLVRRTAHARAQDVAAVYAADTVGAALGALAGGFYCVPVIGLQRSVALAAGGYLLLAAVVWGGRRRWARAPEPVPPRPPTRGGRWLLAAATLSGAAALTFQVVWTRFFLLVFGSSTPAITLVVSGFLLGTGLGSFAVRTRVHHLRRPIQTLVLLQWLIGGTGLLVLKAGPALEWVYYQSFTAIGQYHLFHVVVGLIGFAVLLAPTFLMGAAFPLLVRAYAEQTQAREEGLGLVYGINTAGGILGAFLAGFLLIPWLQMDGASLLAAGGYVLAGLCIAASRPPWRWALVPAGGATLGAVVLFWLLPPLATILGVYYHGVRYPSYDRWRADEQAQELLSRRDGHYGRIHVTAEAGERFLAINGKVDSSTTDMTHQLATAYLPLLLHPAPRQVCVIGLGGGFTLMGVEQFPEVERIDQVELDPLVVAAARDQFATLTDHALEDPRVRVVVDDGRNFLARTAVRYDVVVLQPSNLWVNGVAALYTVESARLIRERLKPGGRFGAWLPLEELDPAALRVAVRTLLEVFPFMQGYILNGTLIVVLAEEPFAPDPARVDHYWRDERIAGNVRAHLGLPTAQFLTERLAAPTLDMPVLTESAATAAAIHTDDRPVLEFLSYRSRFRAFH